MFKRITILAVLATLSVCCMPASAATTSSDEDMIAIALGLGANETGPNAYSIHPGSVAMLGIKTTPDDIVWCFAVGEDPWGVADYSNILTLVFDKAPASGVLTSIFEIPAEISGLVFYIQAVGVNPKGEFKGSEMLTVTIPGVQILLPEPPKAVAADPVLDN